MHGMSIEVTMNVNGIKIDCNLGHSVSDRSPSPFLASSPGDLPSEFMYEKGSLGSRLHLSYTTVEKDANNAWS